MQPTPLHLALLASIVGLGLAGRNCSDNKDLGQLSCYTCMGRDMENCEYGLVCCKGSCYKLIDETHDLIVKGCTPEKEEDASMKRRTLDVTLYWTNGEKISGESYFCNSKDYCNGGVTLSAISSVVALLIFALFH